MQIDERYEQFAKAAQSITESFESRSNATLEIVWKKEKQGWQN
jgi:hypothetical protein